MKNEACKLGSDGVGGRARTLVIGYGNPGRLDDGLGPALVEALEVAGIPGLTLHAAFQLTVEDAAAVAEHDAVIFVDAALRGPEPFEFRPVRDNDSGCFTTHCVSPEAVVSLARVCLGARASAHVLAIRGYEFDSLGSGLSPGAAENLRAALAFLVGLFQER